MATDVKVSGKIQLTKNNTVDGNGLATQPTADDLDFGQLAVNYSYQNPSLFFKDDKGKIIKIVSEEVIADTLVDILGGAAADLSTLKELLDKFGSSDIATTQASILTRLSSVETGKVDKVTGKGLSTNDFSTPEKEKLRDIESGAQVNTVTSVAGKTGPVTLSNTDVGLGNVVNKEQLGKTETATKAKNIDNYNWSGLTGKTVAAARTELCKIVMDNGKNGFFVIQVDSVIADLVGNWDKPEHILRSGIVRGDISVNSTYSNFSFLTFTTYESKFLFTTTLVSGSFTKMVKVMHTDDTAVNSDALNGLNVDNVTSLPPTTSLKFFQGISKGVSGIFPAYTNANAIITLNTHSGDNYYQLGFSSNGSMYQRDFSSKKPDNTTPWRTMWDSGNANLPTVDWSANTIAANNVVHSKQRFEVRRGVNGEKYSQFYKNAGNDVDYGTNIVDVTDGVSTMFIVSKDGLKFDSGGKKTEVYHAGNSNKSNVNWTADNFLSSRIRTTNVNISGAETYVAYGTITTRHYGANFWDGAIIAYGKGDTDGRNKFGVFTHMGDRMYIGTSYHSISGLTSTQTPIEISASPNANNIYILKLMVTLVLVQTTQPQN